MADLFTAALRDEIEARERIRGFFGEDVCRLSRRTVLEEKLIKGKGGVFQLLPGCQCDFGSDRVFNSAVAEANIVGRRRGHGYARD